MREEGGARDEHKERRARVGPTVVVLVVLVVLALLMAVAVAQEHFRVAASMYSAR